MNYSALRAFHAVATEGGFTKAARALGVTQPTLSGQVKLLEEQSGIRLFDRRKRKIELTDTGRNLLDITFRLFGLEAEAEQVLAAAKGLRRGHLRIGADAPYHSVPYLAAFNRRYPNVRLSMSIGNSSSLKADLLDQRFEIIIAADIAGDARLLALPFREDELIAFVDRAHEWSRRKRIKLSDLSGRRLVLREPGSTTRRTFDAAIAKAGIQPGEILEIGSREAIREGVAAGLGIGIVARSEFGDDQRLKALEFEGPRMGSTEYVACLAANKSTPLVKAFVDLVRELPGLS
jgi:LysR family transcriptional regulator, low CO2-responsive transcriptional regulator